MFKYHVTLSEELKAIISVDRKEDLPVMGFRTLGLEYKGPEAYTLQLWDSEFEDWMNVQDIQELPAKGKVMFREKIVFSADVTFIEPEGPTDMTEPVAVPVEEVPAAAYIHELTKSKR
jgi:hypothetical protein